MSQRKTFTRSEIIKFHSEKTKEIFFISKIEIFVCIKIGKRIFFKYSEAKFNVFLILNFKKTAILFQHKFAQFSANNV